MKKNQTLFATTIFSISLFLTSCGSGNTNDATQAENTVEIEEQIPEPKDCKLSKMTIVFDAYEREVRTMTCTYENDKIALIETTNDQDDKVQKLSYTYNESGDLERFDIDKSSGEYIYEDGKLTKIAGKGSFGDRLFEYNDQGQIAVQKTSFRGRVISTLNYEYNTEGLPTKVISLDANGKEDRVFEVTYSEIPNPNKGMGAAMNTAELVLGYPPAEQDFLVSKIKTTYKQKTRYKIGGVHKKPGDVDEKEVKYEVDENGYATALFKDDGETKKATFEYICE